MDEKRLLVERHLISKLAQMGVILGKTKFQKLMYLLASKKIVDVPDYQLYHFGPYSSIVDFDLAYLKDKGAIKVEWIDYGSGYYGYKILPQDSEDASARDINLDAVDKIIGNFGRLSTKELSILATAIYLYDSKMDKSTLVEEVHKLKPNYSKHDIRRILDNYFDRYLTLSL